MPQDFTVGADNQQINQQRLAAIRKQAADNGEVSPYDTVTVYATKKAVDHPSLPEFNKVGQDFIVHTSIADKLVDKGLVTKEAPAIPAPSADKKA